MPQLPALRKGPRSTVPRGHADYCDPALGHLLTRHGLNDFERLWNVDAEDVDAPNEERGGRSTVSLLTLEDDNGQTHRLYLKRQTNHLARSVARPFGEPTFSREWRAIRQYHALGIPSVDAGWYGERRERNQWRAILITFGLDDHEDLERWHQRWPELSTHQHQQIITASAGLVRQIHQAGLMHGCLFPKHVFLTCSKTGQSCSSLGTDQPLDKDPVSYVALAPDDALQMNAVIIDLEKTRRFVLRRHECLRDLYVLWRRLKTWESEEWREFLAVYLDCPCEHQDVTDWLTQLEQHAEHKRR